MEMVQASFDPALPPRWQTSRETRTAHVPATSHTRKPTVPKPSPFDSPPMKSVEEIPAVFEPVAVPRWQITSPIGGKVKDEIQPVSGCRDLRATQCRARCSCKGIGAFVVLRDSRWEREALHDDHWVIAANVVSAIYA